MGVNLYAAQPGMSRLAQAIGGGGGAYQQGYDGEMTLQSKLAQALASMNASNASAGLHNAQAESERRQQGMQTPDAIRRNAMLSSGIPLGEDSAVEAFQQTGQLGGKYGAGDGVGPVVPAPDWQSKLGEVARSMGLTQRALAIGDKNSENIAKAGSIEREGRLSDDIIAGRANRNTVGGAQAAVGGKNLFHTDSSGAVLDLFGGNLDTNNPMAQSSIGLRGAQAGNQKAGAAAHYAQAGASNALAEQRRQVTANGPGPGKVPVGYRYVAGPDGEARLEPIPGGPKDPNSQTGKPLPAAASKGYLENHTALRNVTNALALIQGSDVGDAKGDANATGLKGILPDAILARTDPAGVSARAAIADIGSLKIHDRSGAAVTASETPRLKPFIPSVTDNPATIVKKLRMFEQNYRSIMEESEQFYRDSGYNVPTIKSSIPSKTSAAPAAGGGFTYVGKE